jgi:uncharacterized RDD family membrane protein YckC
LPDRLAQPLHPVVKFPRRLGALLYDSLVLAALWMLATALLLALIILTGGESIEQGAPWFQLYLMIIAGGFFCGFWTHGGQTLGMRAWRAKLETDDGQAVNWSKAGIRFLAALLSIAPCGMGYLWALVDRDRLTWHDRISGTRVVLITVADMEKAARG